MECMLRGCNQDTEFWNKGLTIHPPRCSWQGARGPLTMRRMNPKPANQNAARAGRTAPTRGTTTPRRTVLGCSRTTAEAWRFAGSTTKESVDPNKRKASVRQNGAISATAAWDHTKSPAPAGESKTEPHRGRAPAGRPDLQKLNKTRQAVVGNVLRPSLRKHRPPRSRG